MRGLLCALSIMVSGCALSPEKFTDAELKQLVETTLESVNEQPKPEGPLTLYQAMARALIYNFDTRLDALEEDVARARVDSGFWDFLPNGIVSAGRTHRSNTPASRSRSVATKEESLELSQSTERTRTQADMRFTWNVLDLGVSYFTARQTANQYLMAQERHKKVVRELLQEVRSAYWRAAGAERLIGQVETMLEQIRQAIAKSDEVQASKLQKPIESLGYKRNLYNKLLQIQSLRRNLISAKLDLSKLMNIAPSHDSKVAPPENPWIPPKDVGAEVSDLEIMALNTRPEFIEAGYSERVSADDIKKAMARMLPGVELNWSVNHDSNRFAMHNTWMDMGVKVSWNLLNLMRGLDEIDLAEQQLVVAQMRRQSLGMAIMAQVNVGYLDYLESLSGYETAQKLMNINQELERHQRGQASASNMGELELLQIELDALVAQLKRDEQYAQVQNALGRLMFATGVEVYDALPDTRDVDELAEALEKVEVDWRERGLFKRYQEAKGKPAETTPAVSENPASSDAEQVVSATLTGDDAWQTTTIAHIATIPASPRE